MMIIIIIIIIIIIFVLINLYKEIYTQVVSTQLPRTVSQRGGVSAKAQRQLYDTREVRLLIEDERVCTQGAVVRYIFACLLTSLQIVWQALMSKHNE
jgi:hypothetical protein